MRRKKLDQKKIRWWSITRITGIFTLIISVTIGIFGYLNQHNDQQKPNLFWADFYANIATELAGISITVLVIDSLNEFRETQRLREQLKREMGSYDNGIALRALRELRAYGWHMDGSLRDVNLSGANLQGADLSRANLQGAYLVKTNLKNSKLIEIDLQEAFLNEAELQNSHLNDANLYKVDLFGVNLSGADLSGANLSDANLSSANFTKAVVSLSQLERGRSLADLTLPDGQKYDARLLERLRDLNS
jgi:uncharacterized protein YjbI with pentapeptide repeats